MRTIFTAFFVSVFSISVFAGGNSRNIGIQTFTFSKQTVEELLPMVRECGCDAVGMSRHKLSDKFPDAYVEPKMKKEEFDFLKKIIAENKIKIVSYGVATPTAEKEIRKLFDFAKELGAEVLIAEPAADKLPIWNKFSAEYGIKTAVHNHGKDAKRNRQYVSPKFVRDMIARYPTVFACPDTGHWGRSGVDSVDGFRTLENKIGIVHFRDMNEFDSLSAYDVPIGSGKLGAKLMLAELDRQKFDGYILLEYGGWWKNSLEEKKSEVAKSVVFLKNN